MTNFENFERIMSEIKIEKIARSRIKSLDCGYRTSNGEKYYYYKDALKAEIEWLMQEVSIDNIMFTII